MRPIGVTNRKKTIVINTVELIRPRRWPIANHAAANGRKIPGNNKATMVMPSATLIQISDLVYRQMIKVTAIVTSANSRAIVLVAFLTKTGILKIYHGNSTFANITVINTAGFIYSAFPLQAFLSGVTNRESLNRK